MNEMSKKTLQEALAGESEAHTKYLLFAEKARDEGYPNVARLFEAVAYAERVHARNQLRLLGKLGKTTENLQAAVDGENFEVDEMYEAYLAITELQEEKAASTSHRYALEAEKIHADKYKQALQAINEGSDFKVGDIYICPTCGHTVENDPPERCPVCKVPGSKFRKF